MAQNKPQDLRSYAQQTSTRLIVGGVLLLFVVGDGLIYLIYGPGSALTGLLCLGMGLLPVALIFLVFWLMNWIVARARQE